MWTLIWCGLAMLEAAAILWLVARVMRLQEKHSLAASSACSEKWLAGGLFQSLSEERMKRVPLISALFEIAQQETPGANATVKRMARIAREAL